MILTDIETKKFATYCNHEALFYQPNYIISFLLPKAVINIDNVSKLRIMSLLFRYTLVYGRTGCGSLGAEVPSYSPPSL